MSQSGPTQHYVRKEGRRSMIADAARALIFEKGYAALRTRDVAERTGINVSTLHFHVPSKAALLVLVAETSRDQFFSLLPPRADRAKPARAQLRAEAEAYYTSLTAHPELATCFRQLAEIAAANTEIKEILHAFSGSWCERYQEIISIGRTQGVFRASVVPRPAALVITGALSAFGPRAPGDLAMFWPVFEELERGLLAKTEEKS